VAGFDLTFSPPKSVSTLWAVANRGTAARIETAHREAVKVALRFVEQSLLFTREGTNGARQVDVEGLVGAAFTHRDTRAGDPDLHTHVAVANKVKAVESGKWLAIDGRVLYKGIVAASETYNTALVKQLERQGLQFEDRFVGRDRGRPVREISGVAAELNQRWSTRRAEIEAYREKLVAGFQRDHGRPPTVVEREGISMGSLIAISLRSVAAGIYDAVRGLLHLSPHYMRVFGPPGSIEAFTDPGSNRSLEFFAKAGRTWRNEFAPRFLFGTPKYVPGTAERVRMPLLVCVAEQDTEANPALATEIATKAPRGELKTYPVRHFDVYEGRVFAQIKADQTEFLRRALDTPPVAGN